MQIWIHLNGIQQGPYTIEQLRLLPIDASTPVWYEGLPEWMPAGQAPATASLLASVADGRQIPATTIEAKPPKPNTYLVWNIIFTILFFCPTALAGIITGIISSARYSSGNFAGAQRMSEASAWMLIISIVWAIVSAPLLFVIWFL